MGTAAFRRASCLLAATLALAPGAGADQGTATGNAGTITASASLRFEITINKFVMLRVGDANATRAELTFTLAVTPAVSGAPGNSLAYSGASPPSFSSSISTINPAGTSGALAVAAFTNVPGTVISCTLSPVAGVTPFAAGATAGGVPGTNNILVTGAGVPHPGANLSSCTGAVTTPVTLVSALSGTYTYSTSLTPASLVAGTYGNQITYTIAAP